MSAFLFDVVEEMMNYSRVEDQKALYESLYNAEGGLLPDAKKNLLAWINDMLDLANIPEGAFRKSFLLGYEYDSNDCRSELLTHIINFCEPDARATGDE